MTTGNRITSVLSGMLLANAIPHMLVAVTGQRHMTPFGRDSSSQANALWGAINVAGGGLLAVRADRRTDSQQRAKGWLIPVLAGSLVWSTFMLLYEWITRSR